jgi:hypothetical protein
MDGLLVIDFFLDIVINCFNTILSEINNCGKNYWKALTKVILEKM